MNICQAVVNTLTNLWAIKQLENFLTWWATIRRAQVKVGLINLCKGLFSLNARIYYKLNSGT
jgi:hypothetical protein